MRVAEKWDDAHPPQRQPRRRLGVAGAPGRGGGGGGAADGRARGAAAGRALEAARGDAEQPQLADHRATAAPPTPARGRPSQLLRMSAARQRVLVLGGTGMLGHELWGECSRRFDAMATVRADEIPERAAGVLDPDRTLTGVRVEDIGSVGEALDERRPGRGRQLHRAGQTASRGRRRGGARAGQRPLPAAGARGLRTARRAPDPDLHRLRVRGRPRRLYRGRSPGPRRPLRALQARRRTRGRGRAHPADLDARARARPRLGAARVVPVGPRRDCAATRSRSSPARRPRCSPG